MAPEHGQSLALGHPQNLVLGSKYSAKSGILHQIMPQFLVAVLKFGTDSEMLRGLLGCKKKQTTAGQSNTDQLTLYFKGSHVSATPPAHTKGKVRR
jgi:hypothetical protein